MQGNEDEPVDERALDRCERRASDSLERFWDWREHRPDHTIPDVVQQVFYCADVIAETLERLLIAIHAADRDTVIVKWLATSGACEQYARRRLEVATPRIRPLWFSFAGAKPGWARSGFSTASKLATAFGEL